MYAAPDQEVQPPPEEPDDELEEIKDATQQEDNVRYYNPKSGGLTQMPAH